MRRIRTINGAADFIRAIDPDTAVTTWAIRQAVKSGSIESKRSGTRIYVAVEDVLSYFGLASVEENKEAG